MLESD